jgi:hypothetical protein
MLARDTGEAGVAGAAGVATTVPESSTLKRKWDLPTGLLLQLREGGEFKDELVVEVWAPLVSTASKWKVSGEGERCRGEWDTTREGTLCPM